MVSLQANNNGGMPMKLAVRACALAFALLFTAVVTAQPSLPQGITRVTTVEGITGIRALVQDLNEATRRTSQTMQRQHEAAHAIAADVLAATQEIVLIGQATSQVALASRNTAGASDAVLKAASELTELAQALNARVDHVIGELRVA